MNLQEEKYARIEAYLAGELPEAERTAFEARMAEDKALADEVALHSSMQEIISDRNYLDLRAVIADVGAEYNPIGASPADTKSTWKWWIGGAIILTGLLVWWLWPVPESTIPPETPTVHMDTLRVQEETNPTEPSPQPENKEVKTEPDLYRQHSILEQALLQTPPKGIRIDKGQFQIYRTPGDTKVWANFDGLLQVADDASDFEWVIYAATSGKDKTLCRIPVTLAALPPQNEMRAYAGLETYRASANSTCNLKPGLYYGFLQRKVDGLYIWGQKYRFEGQ